MNLSSELVSQFVKATNDEVKTNGDTTVYGTTVEYNGKIYVRIDGSDRLTPVSTTTDMHVDERVTVTIKNHTATVTGNLTSPSARTDDVTEVGNKVTEVGNKITEVDILIADKVDASQLNAAIARIDTLVADNVTIKEILTATNAIVDNIKAENVEITGKLTAVEADIDDLSANKLDAEVAKITYASISSLEALEADIYNLDAVYATITELEATKAIIAELDAEKLSAEDAKLLYATIDFANISEAALKKIFSETGIIDDLTISDGTVTGTLIGVNIIGDYITSGTIKTDLLIVRGTDGLYYKLNVEGGATTSEQVSEEDLKNGLSGEIIVAKSITAEKVSVDDLVAFGATIGGFNITERSIYSGVKASIDNSTPGVYLDNDGQVVFGNTDNYIKFHKVVDENGEDMLDENGDPIFKLEISADSIYFGSDSRSSADDIRKLTEHVKIGTYVDPETGDEKPCVELAEGDSDFKQVITNTKTMFMDGPVVRTEINTDGVKTDNARVKHELELGGTEEKGSWIWKQRANGNLGLVWKEAT